MPDDKTFESALDYLCSVVADPDASTEDRIAAARAALPYTHRKLPPLDEVDLDDAEGHDDRDGQRLNS